MTAVLSTRDTKSDVQVERKEAGWRKRDRWWGLLFVSPQLVGMIAFVLLPFAVGLVLAFAQWDGLTQLTWVGFANFQAQLADPVFLRLSLIHI